MAVSDFERVDLHMRLLVLGTGQEFNDEIPVYLRRGNSQITFIQTDKPKYKPGQTGERIGRKYFYAIKKCVYFGLPVFCSEVPSADSRRAPAAQH